MTVNTAGIDVSSRRCRVYYLRVALNDSEQCLMDGMEDVMVHRQGQLVQGDKFEGTQYYGHMMGVGEGPLSPT